MNNSKNASNNRLSPARGSRYGKYIAEIDEVRINPIITKKGFLNFLEEKSIGWIKKYVVCYLILFSKINLFCNFKIISKCYLDHSKALAIYLQ